MTFTPHALDPELDLELVRETDVAPELVWRAWTEPELLTQWFTPKPWETPVVEVDLRPGGKFHVVMRGPDGEENYNVGCYLEVIPNERLVWTGALGPGFRPQTGPLLFTAIVELRANGSGSTHYRAIAMHLDPAMRKEHDEMGFHDGWGSVFDQLVELMQSGV
jgi:uncharacterized protein YndB with AHSA1/START domain